MKNIIFALNVFAISSIQILSQEIEDPFINPLWDNYGFNYLNTSSAGRGFTGIASANDISGIHVNPASFVLSSKYQLNFQYTYKTTQEWQPYYQIEPYYSEHQWFSGSAGLGFRISRNILTGILYNNPISMHISLGEISTLYGEVDDFYYNVVYHSLYIPVVYSDNQLHLGGVLSLTHTRTTSPPFENANDPDNLGFSFMFRGIAGFRYEFKNGLSIGAKLQTGGKNDIKTDNDEYPYEREIKGVFPWNAGAGIQYIIPKTRFKILFDYVYTHNISKYYLDRHDIHIGMETNIDNKWIIRGGLFTLNDIRDKTEEWFNPYDNYNQLFLTIGASYQQKNLEANIAILTSEISSGIIKNTYINGGMTFNF